MNTPDCLNIFQQIRDAIDEVNTEIIDHMTNPQMTYERMCQQNDVTYNYFFEELKARIGKICSGLMNRPNKCSHNSHHSLLEAGMKNDLMESIKSLASDPIVFELKPDLSESLHDFLKFFYENCGCEKGDLFRVLARKYFKKYFPIYASDPEIQAYVFGKINFILDHLISLTDQIVLESSEGKEIVHQLRTLLENGKNIYQEPKGSPMTGGSNKDLHSNMLPAYQDLIDKVGDLIEKIKAVDYNHKYTLILNKLQARIGLIHDQLDMIGSKDVKAEIIQNMTQIEERLREHATILKKNINDGLIPYNLETKQLITTVENNVDNLLEKIKLLRSAKTEESIDHMKEAIAKHISSIETQLHRLSQTGNTSYNNILSAAQNKIAELRGLNQSIKVPDMSKLKEKVGHSIEEYSSQISSSIASFDKTFNTALDEIKSQDMGLSLKLREIGSRIRNQLEMIRSKIDQNKLDQMKHEINEKIILLQNELRGFAQRTNRRFGGIEGLQSELDIIKTKLDRMTESAARSARQMRDDSMRQGHQVLSQGQRMMESSMSQGHEALSRAQQTLSVNKDRLLASINHELDVLKANLSNINPTVEKLRRQLLAKLESIREIKIEDDMRVAVNDAIGQIDILIGQADDAQKTLRHASQRNAMAVLDQLKGGLERTKDHLMSLKKEISSDLENHINEIMKQSHSLLNYLKEVSNNLAVSHKPVADKLRDISLQINRRFESSPLSNEGVKSIKKDMENIMKGIEEYVQKNQSKLAEYAPQIRDKLAAVRESLEGRINLPIQLGGVQPDIPNVRQGLHLRLQQSLDFFAQYIESMRLKDSKDYFTKVIDNIADQFTHIYGFSVESELNHLIPDELGSLKKFFVKVISVYYEKLNPVIWAQIIGQLIDAFLVDLPHTPDEMFQFLSKCLLLNSGPFILKTLQMIRPVLSPELATKYNLTKLSYPLMTKKQVNLMLSKVIPDWNMYEITGSFSASVGHVVLVNHVTDRSKSFVLKMIKPISMVQSCGEYSLLYNIYDEGTCERAFVQSIIKSNGREMDVRGEIRNIDMGFKNYTGSYYDVFGHNIDAKITTIENVKGIVNPDCWFALAVTLAPGIPLSKLVESDQLQKDTVFRANLHRCLDLLVYQFFNGIMKEGFYHGDLHAGNIFYSFEHNQITLIDFGAVGELNIYSDDADVYNLLLIFVQSIFHNFDSIFDFMTTLLNEKCTTSGESIDMTSESYLEFKEKLKLYHLNNISLDAKQRERSKAYIEFLNGSERIEEEKRQTQSRINTSSVVQDSVYSFMEIKPSDKEIVVENSSELRGYVDQTETSDSGLEYIGFPSVMEQIIKYYAQSGVNVAIKFTDFYEFQKAYALLLGVLSKTGYNSSRIGMSARKAIVQLSNVPLSQPRKIYELWSKWDEQSKLYDELEHRISNAK